MASCPCIWTTAAIPDRTSGAWGFIQTNGKDRNDPLFEEFPMIGSNGLALDRQDRLIIATWAGRTIDRIEKNGKRTVLADRYKGKRADRPNDGVVKNDGKNYHTHR